VGESTKAYKILVDNANDAIFVLQDGKIQFANPKCLEIVGMSAEALEQSRYTEYLHPDEKEIVVARHQQRLKGHDVLNIYPLRLVIPNGDVLWVEVNAVRIEWNDAPATLNVIRDISTQKMVENHTAQAKNLAAVKTLAEGLAHELNNLLMGIQGRVSLLSMGLGSGNPLQDHLEHMESRIREAAKLSRQLIGFAQIGKFRTLRLNLNDMLSQALAGLECDTGAVDIVAQYQPDIWFVEGDRSQIEQVLADVLANAREAIPKGGRIDVKTENMILKNCSRDGRSVPPGNYVRISIRDTGDGMDESTCKRAFEPFFTTKRDGCHRGLGLSCAFGIAVNHNGLLDIISSKGMGTTCNIFLPAAP
jgi:PAS domain S-box-containing protein